MRERLKDEHGAIAVLAALTIVILFAAVAFVIDISRLYHERQVLQNAVDFGSLAGAQDLPVQGSAQANVASAVARTVAIANAPQVATSGLTIVYQCVVGDRNSDGIPDPEDIPFVCGPTGTWSSGWTTHGNRMIHELRSVRRRQVQHDPAHDQQHDPVLLRPSDRHQHRKHRHRGRRLVQRRVRRCVVSARRGDGARPNREHDAGRHRQREERRPLRARLLRPEPAVGRDGLAPVRATVQQVHRVRRSPNHTAHLSGLPELHGIHVAGCRAEQQLQDGGDRPAQPREHPRPADQLPGASTRLGLRDVARRLARAATTRTWATRWTRRGRCSPPRAGRPCPTSSSS